MSSPLPAATVGTFMQIVPQIARLVDKAEEHCRANGLPPEALIALLHAANIQARYAYGTVQVPIAQVMNWVGNVTNPNAALELLAQGGVPATAMIGGGVITRVGMEHVWVEAYIDYVPSRGTRHIAGDTWIPMDPSFNPCLYRTDERAATRCVR